MPEIALADLGPLHWAAFFLAVMLSAATLLRITAKPDFIDPATRDLCDEPVFLFDREELIDCSTTARALLVGLGPEPRWPEIAHRFGFRFPGFPETPDALSQDQKLTLAPRGTENVCIECERMDELVRVRIRNVIGSDLAISPPDEAALLREGLSNAPYPIWITEIGGAPVWTNTAYDQLVDCLADDRPGARDPATLFAGLTDGKPAGTPVRVAIGRPSEDEHLWFDVTRIRLDDLLIFYASDVTAVVKAEMTQRNFVQTLAKTFAQLSIGLAIFDRQRQLVLFNPALLDLTNLPVDFLSLRPQLLSVFDRLRDLRIMPEPENYASWREQLADLVREASETGYSEIWTLPSGSTYRVTGRPHPDGAVAFLFEDVSSEVSLTRRFRSDVRLGSSVIDEIEDGLVVFDTSGVVAICNRAYRVLWKTDPDAAFADYTLGDAFRFWKSECTEDPVWEDIRANIGIPEGRGEWAICQATSGQTTHLLCRIDPLSDGATMVRFRKAQSQADIRDRPELQQTA